LSARHIFMGKEGTIILKGISGNTYEFEVYPLDTAFGIVGCVYVYTKCVNDPWPPIYIGQTSNLAERIQRHATENGKSDICIQNSGATHILVHQLNDKTARINVETDLRNNYEGRCNWQ